MSVNVFLLVPRNLLTLFTTDPKQVVAFPAIVVSTYDLISIANGLDSLFAEQTPAGQLPYAGFPFSTPPGTFSFTYHMHTLIDVFNYYLWSGDLEYLKGKWDGWKRGMAWSLGTVDQTGLMNVTSSSVSGFFLKVSRVPHQYKSGLASLLSGWSCH